MAIQHTQGKWAIYQDLDDLQIGVQGSKDPKSCDNYRRVCLVTQGGYEIPDYDEAQANAALICDAVNNTAGKGIDPNAVPGLLKSLQGLLEVLGDYPDREYEEAIISAKQSIKSAEIK